MGMTNEEITRYASDPKRHQLIEDLTQEIGPFDASGFKSFDDVGQFGLAKLLPKGEAPRNPGAALDMYLRGRRVARDQTQQQLLRAQGMQSRGSALDTLQGTAIDELFASLGN